MMIKIINKEYLLVILKYVYDWINNKSLMADSTPNCETYKSYRHVSGAYWPKAHIRIDGLDNGLKLR